MKVLERVPRKFLAGYLRLQSCRLGENTGNLRADNHVDCGDLDSQLKDFEEIRLRRYYERLS
jgi:hypothetical protein